MIYDDPLIKKYISLALMESEFRNAYLACANKIIPRIRVSEVGDDIVEIKRFVYVCESLSPVEMSLPYVIIDIITETPFGFSNTMRRLPLTKFGIASKMLQDEFSQFKKYSELKNDVSKLISKKYLSKHITDGKITKKVNFIEYHLSPIFFIRPDTLLEKIDIKEYCLV